MNKRSTGAWAVKGAQLCITRGSEQENCDELWRSGSKLERRKPGLPSIRDTVVILPECRLGHRRRNKTTNKEDSSCALPFPSCSWP